MSVQTFFFIVDSIILMTICRRRIRLSRGEEGGEKRQDDSLPGHTAFSMRAHGQISSTYR